MLEDSLTKAMLAEMGNTFDCEDSVNDDEDFDNVDEDQTVNSSLMSTKQDAAPLSTTQAPEHFSQIDLSACDAEVVQKFPLFKEAHSMTVNLKAGEMLYLPAGWFHEVQSENSSDACHMAFNFWFHPPDGDSYTAPYRSPFWAWDWQRRTSDGGDSDL